MGGGLGGGSSDAATMLALNQLWELHLNRDRLLELGLQLGADVRYLRTKCLAEGIGEKLVAIELPPPGIWFLKFRYKCQLRKFLQVKN